MNQNLVWALLPIILFSVSGLVAQDIDDASGIHINGDSVIIVGNLKRDSDHFYPYNLSALPAAEAIRSLTNNNPRQPIGDKKGEDLEDIDVLDGNVIVLCENKARVLDSQGILLVYEVTLDDNSTKSVREDGDNRGLEGLAVHPISSGDQDTLESMVAVSWEGGQGKSPRIYLHRVKHGDLKSDRPAKITNGDAKMIKLKTEMLRKLTGRSGSFRVPGIVFTHDGLGFIAIVSKRNQAWLMRFDLDGRPIGGIRTFASLGMSSDDVERNWEGIAWNGKQHLVLISDNHHGEEGTTKVFNARLPQGW